MMEGLTKLLRWRKGTTVDMLHKESVCNFGLTGLGIKPHTF